MNLHLHGEAFRELVELTANHFGYEQSHVEKDYWVSKILKELVFSYDTHYKSTGLKENLEVEIKCCTLEDKSIMYYPMQKRQIWSVIAEYLQTVGRSDIIAGFGLDAFEVQATDPKRTLCDKISRLTRLSYNGDYEMLIAKNIRDVYDIYRILNILEYRIFIQSDEFIDAMQRVTGEDGLYRNSQSHQFISKARVFAETRKTLNLPAIYRAYNNELKQLMFEVNTLPALDEVIQNIELLHEPLWRFDEKYHSTTPSFLLTNVKYIRFQCFFIVFQ
jgi:hypothetical protein